MRKIFVLLVIVGAVALGIAAVQSGVPGLDKALAEFFPSQPLETPKPVLHAKPSPAVVPMISAPITPTAAARLAPAAGSAEDNHAINHNSGGSLASGLKSGMRAITLGADSLTGGVDHVAAGDHVDVLFTHNSHSNAQPTVSEVLASNVPILAVDNAGVSLAVADDMAQKIRLAEKIGALSLALRPAKDDDDETPEATYLDTLPHIQHTVTAMPEVSAPGIRIVRGGDNDRKVVTP